MFTRYETKGSIPSANWATLNHVPEEPSAEPYRRRERPRVDLNSLMAGLRGTLLRDSDAASVIQRLAFRIDGRSELSQRAREYAAELRHLTARLEAYLPAHLPSTRTRDHEADATKMVIQTLDPEAAAIILIRYVLQHAEATREILSGVGEGLNARAIEMLCRKAAREKQRIVAWIDRHFVPDALN